MKQPDKKKDNEWVTVSMRYKNWHLKDLRKRATESNLFYKRGGKKFPNMNAFVILDLFRNSSPKA